MKAGRIVVAIVAALFALMSLALLFGGAAMVWAHGTQRDADGFITSPDYELVSAGFAVTSAEVDLASETGAWWPTNLADVRFDVAAADDQSVFVGIGPAGDVAAYLGGVARNEVAELGSWGTDVVYESFEGAAPATAPGAQGFWVASTEGTGQQSLTWDVTQGEWTVVVMNADASAGVAATAEAGVRIGVLLAVGIGLLLGGLVLGGIAAGMLVWATGRPRTDEEIAAGAMAGVPAGGYPVTVDGALDPRLSRWMWLVKWFLAIPHFIVLAFLWVAFALLTVVAFFAILFTGRYPRGIFDFNVGVLRWTWRVGFYSYSVLGTDRYPPFTLQQTDYPADLDVVYPERLSRGLVLVKWWLLAIPQYLIVGLLTSGLIWWTTDVGNGDAILQVGGGLIGLIVFIAAVALLFTGRYLPGLFDLVMGLNRWVYRVGAYAALMTDEYPPFRLDSGGSDPNSDPAKPLGPSPSGSEEPIRPAATADR